MVIYYLYSIFFLWTGNVFLCSQPKPRSEVLSEESSDDGYCGEESETNKTNNFYPITYKIGNISVPSFDIYNLIKVFHIFRICDMLIY